MKYRGTSAFIFVAFIDGKDQTEYLLDENDDRLLYIAKNDSIIPWTSEASPSFFTASIYGKDQNKAFTAREKV